MMTQEKYLRTAETFDNLAARAEQLMALSRVIEDAAASPDRDDQSIRAALWLLSTLLEEHGAELTTLQQEFFAVHKP